MTSANISSQPSPRTAEEVYAQLGGRIALIIDGSETPGGVPSTLWIAQAMKLKSCVKVRFQWKICSKQSKI